MSATAPKWAWLLAFGLGAGRLAGGAAPEADAPSWPRHLLRAEAVIPLDPPKGERFDASGLLRTAAGQLLTLSDRQPGLYRIVLQPGAAAASLAPLPGVFTAAQLERFGPEKASLHYDLEGLAQDEQGRFYVCDEADRWILRCDPKAGRVERLAIDWSPVTNYFGPDPNASFEGMAIGDGRLYVANERSAPVILAVELATLKVVDRLVVVPRKGSLFGTHYADLAWWDHRLFVLCRQHQVVLEVEPRSHTVLAEYDYAAAENALGYGTLGMVGLMEGLAVERDWLWLVIDNNGLARRQHPGDIRPVLLKCRRPAEPDKGGRPGPPRPLPGPPPGRAPTKG